MRPLGWDWRNFPISFWLKRNLICRWFHRKHGKSTGYSYGCATGVKWYCHKCYYMTDL